MKAFVRRIRMHRQRQVAHQVRSAIGALPSGDGIFLVDVGAAGQMQPRWAAVAEHVHFIGFEPDQRSPVASEDASRCASFSVYPSALGPNRSQETLYLCRTPQVSSTLVPNEEFLDRFPNPQRFDVVDETRIDVRSVDQFRLARADFLKVDVQGGELGVLSGASALLEEALGIEVEVEFTELYRGQPLFGAVSELLAKRGLDFMDFTNLCRWERARHSGDGQCVFGDALFLRSPESVTTSTRLLQKLDAYLCILLLYRRFDLIEVTLRLLPESLRAPRLHFAERARALQRMHEMARRVHRFAGGVTSLIFPGTRMHAIY